MIGERTRKVVPPNCWPINEDTGQEIVIPKSHDRPYYLLTQVLLFLLSLLYSEEIPLILWGLLLDFCCRWDHKNIAADKWCYQFHMPKLSLGNLAF